MKLGHKKVQAAMAKRGFSGRTAQAVEMILCDDVQPAEAARKVGIGAAGISRMLGKLLTTRTCPCCNQPIKELKS